jgi:hypothetical protein
LNVVIHELVESDVQVNRPAPVAVLRLIGTHVTGVDPKQSLEPIALDDREVLDDASDRGQRRDASPRGVVSGEPLDPRNNH